MKKFAEIAVLLVLAAAGVALWIHFALPRYQEIDLSVKQPQAVRTATQFLVDRGVRTSDYQTAAVFHVDDGSDRYLQRTLGIQATSQLLRQLDYDLFSWTVRFFKEKQKEEFKVTVSSKTGQVIAFYHEVEDTAERPLMDKDQARLEAFEFLKKSFGFDAENFVFHREDVKKLDHRVDYTFSWEAKGVEIPWEAKLGGGSAKLLTTVGLSGGDVLHFRKYWFKVPDAFERYVQNLKETGENLSLVFHIAYLALLTMAIMILINRKQHHVPRMVKSFYLKVGVVFFLLMLIEIANGYQLFFYIYPTPLSFLDFMVRAFIKSMMAPLFIALAFILPGLAGESLRFECDKNRKLGGFLAPILSSFLTQPVARQVLIGYPLAALVLGVQGWIFHMGYQHCGVWNELTWLNQSSTTIVPAFTALLIGFQAAFTEEVTFRLFAINFFRRYGLPMMAAVFLSSLIWGFGHSGYAIFPMWFRGVEVTLLGLILAYAYLRYGLITVIVAHFLMDTFLISMPYLFKPGDFDFFSSCAVLGLPLVFAVVAGLVNRSTQQRSWEHRFNAQQQFNYLLLKGICQTKSREQWAVLQKDLLKHGWDPAVIERVFKELS